MKIRGGYSLEIKEKIRKTANETGMTVSQITRKKIVTETYRKI